MADYWIKLYHEILNDPKMGTLPDRLWRRVIEMFLIAGQLNSDHKTGELPNTIQLSWMLRMDSQDLQFDLEQIAVTGIIEHATNGWFIPNFEKRQGAVSVKERKAQQREREHANQYYGNVTTKSRSVTQNRTEQIQNRTETEAERESADALPPPPDPAKPLDYDALSPRQAMQIPEIKTFHEATGRMPGRPTYRTVVEIIQDHSFDADYLKPFWTEWNVRGFRPENLAWLTEWAASGEIPPKNGRVSIPKTAATDARAELDRIIAEGKVKRGK